MATQIKRDEHIHLADGRNATLSAVQLSDGKYETMLLLNDGSGEEVVSYQSTSADDAVYFFYEIKNTYHVPELTGKYKKLADDLKAAHAYGLAHMGNDDGGTCNFDAPALTLPGWDKNLSRPRQERLGLAALYGRSGTIQPMCFLFAASDRDTPGQRPPRP